MIGMTQEQTPSETMAAEARARVMRWSIPFWIGAAILPGINVAAGFAGHPEWLTAALALTGAYALCGIGYGIWAGWTVTRRA